jgi:hypothetical protein
LQRVFPLNVLIVHSSMLVVATDGERMTCGGFSLSETVYFGSLEFIVDCFNSLSISPKGSNSGTIFVGTTRSGSPSLRATIEDSNNEFYMAPSREGSSGVPASQRHSMGPPLAPIVTTPWLEDAPNTHTMTMVPSQTLVPWPDSGLPLEW